MTEGGAGRPDEPLLERETVLDRLSTHLEAARRGAGRLVLLRGEAGAGKTSVIQRFATGIAGRTRVLVGACDPLSTPGPLGPLLDVAKDLGHQIERAVDDALSGRAAVHVVFHALLDELRNTDGPLVLVFEDLHWADGATCDLLRYLARRLDQVPVLVLGSYRDDELSGPHPLTVLLGDLAGHPTVHGVRVEPLSDAAVAVLADGRGIDPVAVYRATGGNPFFVTELVAAPNGEVPASVSDVVLGRLARLEDGTRAVAEAVAVLGAAAEPELIQALVPPGVEPPASGNGLLCAAGDGIGFRHELARMAVWASIPQYRRAGLHARALAALRSRTRRPGDLAHLAHHAEHAGDGPAVLEFATAAAVHAEGLRAHAEAAAQYRRALRHADDSPAAERAPLLEGLGLAAFRAGDNDVAINAMRDAALLHGDAGEQLREGDDLRWLALMLRTAGRVAEAAAVLDDAQRTLEALPPGRELAEVYVHRCLELSYSADLAGTRHYAERARALAEAVGEPGLDLQARYYVARARVASTGEGWPELERLLDEAVHAGLQERTGFLFMTASAVASLHRDGRGHGVMRRAEEFCAAEEMSTYLLATRAHGTLQLLHRGRWSEAAETAAEVLAHPSAAPIVRPPALAALGLVRARRGDPQAEVPLDEAVGLVESDLVLHLNPVWEARAEAAWLRGDHGRAEAEARAGLAALDGAGDPWLTGALMRWVRLAGGTPPPQRAARPFALELAGDWEAAATEWERLDCAYDAALARLDGDVPALLRAWETFDELGARPAAAIAASRLRAQGVRPGVRGPRASTREDPHGLTARQREILGLVAEGLTDAQIAARLHLSAKTVNHHVTAVLAKLGVHSRAEAVNLLVRR